jgi:hypothetical protein
VQKENNSTFTTVLKKQENAEWLSKSTEQSPSGGQGIPLLFWKPKVHYSIQKSPTQDAILSQVHPVHTAITLFI